VWCSIHVLVGCIYKSPYSSKENVENLFKLLKSDVIRQYDKVCIVGDFNFPSIKWTGEWTGQNGNEFVECVRPAFLTQVVTQPTRRREGQNPSLIDLILVNDESMVSDISHCNPFGKSDHETLLFHLYLEDPYSNKENFYKYDFNQANFKNIKQELAEMDWSEFNELSVHQCWATMKESILNSIEKKCSY
jgi:hypothetical protein